MINRENDDFMDREIDDLEDLEIWHESEMAFDIYTANREDRKENVNVYNLYPEAGSQAG